MVAPVKLNFKIYQGSTFSQVLRWESATKMYKTITGITKAAPAVVTCPGHTIPVGWRVKFNNIGGMKELNSDSVYRTVTAVENDTFTMNDVNSTGYTAYTSGGIVEYNDPVSLASYTARMQIREKINSTTVLYELTTENGRILLDNVSKTITITIPASDSQNFTFKQGVYSLEMVKDSVVVPLVTGSVQLETEITR